MTGKVLEMHWSNDVEDWLNTESVGCADDYATLFFHTTSFVILLKYTIKDIMDLITSRSFDEIVHLSFLNLRLICVIYCESNEKIKYGQIRKS